MSKQYKVILQVERQVAEGAHPDIQLIVLRRAGGPSDSVIPRYYMGSGKTRKWALLQAFNACREHGGFEPVLSPSDRKARVS